MNKRRLAGALVALAFSLTGACAPVLAADALPPAMREIRMQSRHTYRYTCADSKTFKVTYLNASNGQSFALVPVDGRTLLLVSTVAASGVRYQAERYTWWTKGPRADLYDSMAGENAKPLVAGCATILR